MKKTNMLKIITVLIMGVILFVMSIKVFALDDSSDPTDLLYNSNGTSNSSDGDTDGDADGDVDGDADGEYTDTTNDLNTTTNTNTNTSINTNVNTNTTSKSNTNTSNYNTSLPKAGAPENTLMGVAITVLTITAVYAYKKIKDYKNI